MKRSFRVSGLDSYDLEGPIGQVISKLQEFQNQHPHAVLDLDAQENYGSSPYVELYVTEQREETDAERDHREQQEAQRAKFTEQRQRLEYEALKKKFGDA